MPKNPQRSDFMATVGNLFAIGILILISMVFFKNKYYLDASKCYIILLSATFASTAIHTAAMEVLKLKILPVWAVKAIATVNLSLMHMTISFLALYLICKIIEHTPKNNNLFKARVNIFILLGLSIIFVLLNLVHGYIFTVDESGTVVNSEIFYIDYIVMAINAVVVVIYLILYRKHISASVRNALVESVPIAAFSTILKLCFNDLSIAMLTVVLIELIFFLNFQNHRIGVNTLTKLNNSQRFLADANRRIKKQVPFKSYVIKIQNLGTVKQNHGHKTGDEVLYHFGVALDKLFSNAITFHMYGTVLAQILPYDEAKSAAETEKLIKFLEHEIDYMDLGIVFDCIVAEHVWCDEANADVFYEKLEYATDMAKLTKQKYVNYSLDLEIKRLRERYLINRMQTITSEEGFEIWFQPIYSNGRKSFTSMESLLRLREKNGTFISPAEFIPLAEKTGQITPITWFVIDETCRALAQNPELKGIRASINLPMLLLTDPEFEDKLNTIVDGYDIPHRRISFEFTERVILEDLEIAERNMKRLVKSGYTFYLDDFGVGYSNFNCVLRLPLKTVKLDMTLTATVEKLVENQNLVKILTDLFHDMGLKVVAEGAETAEQVELLREYGIDGIQGYYFAKPMPLPALKLFLEKKKSK